MKKIENDREYYAIKKRLDELLEIVTDENYDSIPEAIELEFLAGLIENYEEEYFPITPPGLPYFLREYMHEKEITQKELADILSVSASRISEYLSGKDPSFAVARLMYENLNISPYVFFEKEKKQKKVERRTTRKSKKIVD